MEKVTTRRILITGGAGFIGYHLSFNLAQDPANHIVLVDNFVRGKLDSDLDDLVARPNIQLISADLTDTASYKQFGNGYDEVYHFAAIIGVQNVLERPQEVIRVNALSCLFMLDWFCQGGGKKIVFSSTSEAYGWTHSFHELPVPTPEAVPLSLTDLGNPRSSYAGSKIFGELAITQYCSVYNKQFAIVRYHNIYGPRMGHEHVIPELYYRILDGEDPLTVYSADHSRAFCYVTDAVTATIKTMRENAADGQTLNIGNDKEEIVIADLAKSILDKAGVNAGFKSQTAANDPIVRRCPDINQARKLIGYEPQVTLDEGLDLTLKWYSEKYNSKVVNK